MTSDYRRTKLDHLTKEHLTNAAPRVHGKGSGIREAHLRFSFVVPHPVVVVHPLKGGVHGVLHIKKGVNYASWLANEVLHLTKRRYLCMSVIIVAPPLKGKTHGVLHIEIRRCFLQRAST